MATEEEENWIKLSLIREEAVYLSRKLFQLVWNKLIAAGLDSPWESTPECGNQLWELVKPSSSANPMVGGGPKVQFEPHEEAFIRSGELDTWELQILSKLFKALGVDDKMTIVSAFKDAFAGVLKKKKIDTASFRAVKRKVIPLLNEWPGSEVERLVSEADLSLAKTHLAFMEIIRKGHMLRIFMGKKLKAIDAYGKVLELENEAEDETLAISYILRSAFELAETDEEEAKKSGTLLLTLAERRAKIEPDLWQSHVDLGKVHMLLGNRPKAREAFNKARLLNPTNVNIKTLLHSAEGHGTLKECSLDVGLQQLREQIGVNFPAEEILRLSEKAQGLEIPAFTGFGLLIKGISSEEGFNGAPADLKKAVEFYEKSIGFNNAEAMYRLSKLYLDGRGVKKDLKKSAELLIKAVSLPLLGEEDASCFGLTAGSAAPGVGFAMLALGEYYHQGIYYEKNYQTALSWFRKAHEIGNATAGFYIGIYYAEGIIVSRDLEKAKQYWKLAADVGHVASMVNLARLYLREVGDIKMATEWFRRAKEKGVFSEEEIRNFEKDIKDGKEAMEKIADEEKRAGISVEANMNIKDRLSRVLSASSPECSDLFSEFAAQASKYRNPRPEGTDLPSRISLQFLLPYAKKGMVYAKHLVQALNSYEKVIDLVVGNVCSGVALNDEEIVQAMASFYRFNCEYAVGYTMDFVKIVSDSVKRTMNSNPTMDLEKDARICWLGLNFSSLDVDYAAASVKKFPDEPHLLRMYMAMLCFQQDFEKAVKVAAAHVKKFPTDFELQYDYAASLRLSCDSEDDVCKAVAKESIKHYLRFIELAPKDHRKVPEAFYAIAYLYLQMKMLHEQGKKSGKSDATMELVNEYMTKGKEAEKYQLPCFLPYDSQTKGSSELLLKVFSLEKVQKSKGATKVSAPPPTSPEGSWPEHVLTDPQRVKITLAHRKFLAELREKVRGNFVSQITIVPPKNQAAPPCRSSMRSITLKEMDASKDRVYSKRQLKLTCIEDGMRMTGLNFVAEDVNGDTQRLSVYNTKDDDPRLVYGSKITVLNPYMRIAVDGNPVIRVDDPASLIFHEDEYDPDRCRFCGKGGAAFKCGKCFLAKYCTADCQKRDWKVLKHSLICSKQS